MKLTKRFVLFDMKSFCGNFIGGTHRFIPLMFSFFIAILGCGISFAQWWEPHDTAVFVFGGDVMLARNVGRILDTAGVNYPFAASEITCIMPIALLLISNLLLAHNRNMLPRNMYFKRIRRCFRDYYGLASMLFHSRIITYSTISVQE